MKMKLNITFYIRLQTNILQREASTSTSSVGRKGFASKNLLKNVGNVKSKSALGFLYIISVYVLNTPYFAYYAYRKIHYEQSYSFEIINMNSDYTSN